MYRVLVCDDEKDIVSALKIYLQSENMEVLVAYNGKEALEIINEEDVDLIILDVMMPVMDGITAMSKIREQSNVPVILLTAKGEDTDKILGLNVGADDYVTKPFNPVELIARAKSQLRRYTMLGGSKKMEQLEEGELYAKGLKVDHRSKEAFLDGEKLALTKTEYDILYLLMKNPGKVYSPKEIYELVWQDVSMGNDKTVAVHIRHLREKIEIDPANPRYIKVIWGRGYKFEGE